MASDGANSQLANGNAKPVSDRRKSQPQHSKKREENGSVELKTKPSEQTDGDTSKQHNGIQRLNSKHSWGQLLSSKELLPGQTVPSSGVTDGGTVVPRANGTLAGAPKPALTSTNSCKSVLDVPNSSHDDKDSDRLSLTSRRDSTRLSLDSLSRRSVDYRIPDHALAPVNTKQEEKPKSLIHTDDSIIRTAIPYLPTGLAVICLIFNILLPGTGTVISGFSIFCCGKTRVPSKDDHMMVTLWVNVWVGFAQLFTVPLLLVGWFWGLAWGIKMVILSLEFRKEEKAKRDKDLQTLALSAFGSPGRGILPV